VLLGGAGLWQTLELAHNVMGVEDIGHLTNLQKLVLISSSSSSYVFVDAFRTAGTMTDLRHLHLAASGIEDYEIEIYNSLSTLVNLDTLIVRSFVPRLASSWVDLVGHLTSLQYLEIDSVKTTFQNDTEKVKKDMAEAYPRLDFSMTPNLSKAPKRMGLRPINDEEDGFDS